MSRIEVLVQVGPRPSSSDLCLRLELDPIRQEALTPLDFAVHSPGYFCSPTDLVRTVTRTREGIAREITAAIMKALGERDTLDGYPKETP